MARRNRIVIVLCIAAAVMLCTAAFGEKGENKGALPAAVEAAIKALFPKATVDESKMDQESLRVYEVGIKDVNKEYDVTVSEDGVAAEVCNEETLDTLPAAVAQAIKAQNGEVKEAEKEVKYAQLKMVKLDTPVTSYEAKIIKDDKTIEIKIAVDGTILKQHEAEKKKCDKDKDDDDKGSEH